MTAPGAPIVRRVPLPAELRSPGSARSVVRSVAAEAGLDDLLDEALLLTTELVTNAVLHAGTDVTVEVVADHSGLTVTVLDELAGPLLAAGSPATADGIDGLERVGDLERGRGLQLVDRLAQRWGTVHHPGGKGVWFHLSRPGAAAPDARMPWPSRRPARGTRRARRRRGPPRATGGSPAPAGPRHRRHQRRPGARRRRGRRPARGRRPREAPSHRTAAPGCRCGSPDRGVANSRCIRHRPVRS